MRKLLTILVLAAALCTVLSAVPAASARVYGKPAIVASGGHYYAEWYCTLYGGAVAAGYILLSEEAAVMSIVGGSYWTAACELGSKDWRQRTLDFGIQRSSDPLKQCWVVIPRRGHTAAWAWAHRFTQCMYTV